MYQKVDTTLNFVLIFYWAIFRTKNEIYISIRITNIICIYQIY